MRHSAHFIVLTGLVLSVLLADGCVSTKQSDPRMPFTVIMKSMDAFVVNGKTIGSGDLVKTLQKQGMSRNEPLIIEIPAGTSFDSVKVLTQRLVNAGYRPFFKYPRHADSSTEASAQRGHLQNKMPPP